MKKMLRLLVEHLFLFFPLQVFVSDAAIQALLAVAVVLLQLDEGLTVAGVGRGEPALGPEADDVVVLGLQFLEEAAGSGTECFVVLVLAVSIEKGDDGVDEEQVECGGA